MRIWEERNCGEKTGESPTCSLSPCVSWKKNRGRTYTKINYNSHSSARCSMFSRVQVAIQGSPCGNWSSVNTLQSIINLGHWWTFTSKLNHSRKLITWLLTSTFDICSLPNNQLSELTVGTLSKTLLSTNHWFFLLQNERRRDDIFCCLCVIIKNFCLQSLKWLRL